jgi:hypothetical protein
MAIKQNMGGAMKATAPHLDYAWPIGRASGASIGPARHLGVFLPPSVFIPNMPFSSTVGKIDDERMCLKLIGGNAGGYKCFAMCGEAAIRDRENCGLCTRRRRLSKVPNG